MFFVPDIIYSLTNPSVKELVKLRESPRHRRESSRFVVEGAEEFNEIFSAGKDIETVYFNEELAARSKIIEQLSSWKSGKVLSWQELGENAFRKASYQKNPDGILAVVKSWSLDISFIDLSGESPVGPFIILDEIEKPGNLGAILRTGEALGVHSFILCDPSVDFFNPNVVRSSRGLMSRVSVAIASKETVFEWVKKISLPLIATSSKTHTLSHKFDYPENVVLVFGKESSGLGEFWKSRVKDWVKLQMPGTASSLNLNVSVGCILNDYNRSTGKI